MIQSAALFVAAHENIYGFVLFFSFGKTPVKKCHHPLPHPFKHIMWEVWVKCPFSSWTAVTSNPAAHGGSCWYQTSASESSCPSTACVMGMGQMALFLSPSCSRLSFPAPFLSASSSTFCCHTSGFEHGATSWIWSLAAVCCQRFPTEDRDGIQKARGNGGQAGKVHSRWRLRQNQISTGAMSFSLLSTQLHECLPLQHVSPIHFSGISENVDCFLHLFYLWMSSFWMQTSTAGCVTTRITGSTSQWTQQKSCMGEKLYILLKLLTWRHFFHLPSGRCQLDAAGEFSPCSSSSLSEQEYFKGYEVPTAVSEGWKRGGMEPGNVLSVSCGNNRRSHSVSRALRWNFLMPLRNSDSLEKHPMPKVCLRPGARGEGKRKLGLTKTHLRTWKPFWCLPQLWIWSPFCPFVGLASW